jgi:thiol-disulfide isomerase/thioredoxin
MPRSFRHLILVLSLLGLVAQTGAEEAASAWLTTLALRDLTGSSLRPAGRWIILVFISPECPVANAEIPVLKGLAAEFSARDFSFVGVYADPALELATLRRHAAEYQLNFPTVDDREQRVMHEVGATYTPEVLVYARSGGLLYRGRIDNRVEDFGAARPAATQNNLRYVLAALVAGESGPFPDQPGFGCTIPKPVKP